MLLDLIHDLLMDLYRLLRAGNTLVPAVMLRNVAPDQPVCLHLIELLCECRFLNMKICLDIFLKNLLPLMFI